MHKKKKNRILAVLIAVMLCACAAAGAFLVKEAGRPAGTGGPVSEEPAAEAEEPEVPAEPQAVIFAASDYQADGHFAAPADTLRGLIGAVLADGKLPEEAVFCGDYTNELGKHDYQLSPEDSIEEIRGIVAEEAPSVEETLFVQGNHDRLTESIAESGLHEFDDYLIYVVNTQNDFPWQQGVTSGCLKKVTKTSEDMKACFDSLIKKGETRPLIITGHVPLHFTARTSSRHSTGDNLYSQLIFDAVNEAAQKLDIVYLYGHNHSKGWDCYLGGSCVYRAPGDEILIPEFDEMSVTSDSYTERTLNFTYMNAGYTGYYMNCAPGQYSSDPDSQYRAADETLTCSVLEIYQDRIEITRYDADGTHALGSDGEGDPYKGGIDSSLIGPEHYSTEHESPAVIPLKNRKQDAE